MSSWAVFTFPVEGKVIQNKTISQEIFSSFIHPQSHHRICRTCNQIGTCWGRLALSHWVYLGFFWCTLGFLLGTESWCAQTPSWASWFLCFDAVVCYSIVSAAVWRVTASLLAFPIGGIAVVRFEITRGEGNSSDLCLCQGLYWKLPCIIGALPFPRKASLKCTCERFQHTNWYLGKAQLYPGDFLSQFYWSSR